VYFCQIARLFRESDARFSLLCCSELCYNAQAMWLGLQIAVNIGLVVGYILFLLVVLRNSSGREKSQRLLAAIATVAALWVLVLGLTAILVAVGWYSYPTSEELAPRSEQAVLVRFFANWLVVFWDRLIPVGLVVLVLLGAEFTNAFALKESRRWPRLLTVFLLVVTATALDLLAFQYPAYTFPITFAQLGFGDGATLLWVLAWFVSTAVAWWTCLRAWRHAMNYKHRNRYRYLFAVLSVFVIGDSLTLFDGVAGVHIGLAVRLLGFFVLAFSTLHHDLPDVKRFVLAGTRFALLAGLTLSLYLIALLSASYASITFPGVPGLEVVWPAFVLALLMAAIIDVWLAPRLHRLFDRTFLGRDYDVQRALRTYSSKINLILDLDRLADTTLDWLKTTMRVGRSAFILLTPAGDGRIELRVLRCTAEGELPSQIFSEDSRFVDHFRRHGRPLSQYDVDMLSWFQSMPAGERQWLKGLDLDLYVPVLVAERLVALLAMGSKLGGRPYSDEDLETLMTLAGQTGTALENARLLDQLLAVQDDLQRVGDELVEVNRQFKQLDKTKADFVAIASHELRTPLTQIYGYSDMLSSLESDELSDAQLVNNFITGITKGASRLKQVVEAMVDVSLIETGALRLNPTLIPLSVVVHNSVENVRASAEQRQIQIKVQDLSTLPYIKADGARLEQVFGGLLSNAIKFTPDGGQIVISGNLGASSAREAYVELEVADNGIGIDPEQQDLIFQKFYRSEDTLLHSTDAIAFKGAGPGLGLSIAQGIVNAHGGRVWVESPGRDEERCPGSTFHVRLPVAGPQKE
jgi:signal transduction histidine kinase